MKRAYSFSLFILLTFGFLWSSDYKLLHQDDRPDLGTPPRSVRVELTGPAVLETGQKAIFQTKFTNITGEPVRLCNYPGGVQIFLALAAKEKQINVLFSEPYMDSPDDGVDSIVLSPGETRSLLHEFRIRDDLGIGKLDAYAGMYEDKELAKIMKRDGTTSSIELINRDFLVRQNYHPILILAKWKF